MWYYAHDGQAVGPVDEVTLRARVAEGVVTPQTSVWREGMEEWREAGSTELAGWFGLAPTAPVPPAGPATPVHATFNMGEAISYGWRVFNDNVGFFLLLMLVYGICYWGPHFVATALMEVNPVVGIVAHIADILLTLLMGVGLIKISLDLCDGKDPKISDLFSQIHLLGWYILASILYLLVVVAGYILLIVPGIILGLMFFLYDYLIVDEGLGPIESLSRSAKIMRGRKGELFLFNILLVLINLAGALVCLVGLIATIPSTTVAMAYAYRCFRYEHDAGRLGT